MALRPSAITFSTNNFVAEESDLIRNGLSQQMANEIYENGGFMVSFSSVDLFDQRTIFINSVGLFLDFRWIAKRN